MVRPHPLPCRLWRALPALLLAAPQVQGADGWQASLAATSDYVQRGISQNDGDPALQAAITYWSPTGWYAGAWGSQVDMRVYSGSYYYPARDRADVELNLFAGFSERLGDDWTLDLRAVGYWYPDDPGTVSYDYLEVAMSVAWRQHLYASLAISPSVTWPADTNGARNEPSYDAGLSLQQPVSDWLTWMIGGGYRELVTSRTGGYFYGSTSLVVQWQRCTFELGYYGTDSAARRMFGERLAGGRTAFTASVSF